MKKILGLAAAGMMLMFVIAPSASAAEFIRPDSSGGTVTLSNGETHKNVYVAGGSVFINSNISGDLYAAAGTVIVEAPVAGDVVILGGTLTINGAVSGDVRILGGDVTINNAVGGDVVMATGTLHLTEKSTVGGDLMAVGGTFDLDGPVTGQVKINGGDVRLNSVIAGNADITASNSLTLDSKANVPNTLLYHGANEAVHKDGSTVGNLDFQKIAENRGGRAGHFLAGLFTIVFVIKVIGLILAGLLLIKLFPRTSRAAVDSMHQHIWSNLGIGLVALIVGPILFVILLITFVGIYIALILLCAWLIVLWFAALVASIYVGAWIIMKLSKKNVMIYDWQALAIGVVAIGIISIIPVIGILVVLIFILMAFGGIIRQLHTKIKGEQNYTNSSLTM
jgi:hypothetical protein